MEEKKGLTKYLYAIRFYFLFVVLLFIGAIAIGYGGFLNEVFQESFEWLQQLSEGLENFSESYPPWLIFLALFVVIFVNNAFTCFLNIITGPLMGIFPLFSTVLNGGLLGWLAREEGLFVFLTITPHGMFELPAYFLSVAIGLRLARELFKPKEERQLKAGLGEGLRVYLVLIVPLLLIAAFIESGLILLNILLSP